MKRAHNRMKRAHKDDRGTNLIWAKCSIGAPYTGLKFSHIFDAFNSFGLIDFVLFVLILHIFFFQKNWILSNLTAIFLGKKML